MPSHTTTLLRMLEMKSEWDNEEFTLETWQVKLKALAHETTVVLKTDNLFQDFLCTFVRPASDAKPISIEKWSKRPHITNQRVLTKREVQRLQKILDVWQSFYGLEYALGCDVGK